MKLIRYQTPLILLVAWQMVSSLELIPKYKLPSPVEVALSFRDLLIVGIPPGYRLLGHLIYSVYRVALGCVVAASIGVPLGILMGWSEKLRELAQPLIEMVRPVPPLAWIPISILWFGIGIKSATFIIFLGAFFPIVLNTVSGVLSTNPILIRAALSLNAKDKDIIRKVLIPSAVPSIFVGLRIGVGIGWMTLVAAEFTGTKSGYGLGYMIMTARDIQRPDMILAGMISIGLVGFFINEGLGSIESRVVKGR